MYTADNNKPMHVKTVSSPVQLIEKARSFSEDDDLLSPFDTGDVERQIQRAWWKTCAVVLFLLSTFGAIMFVIIKGTHNNNNNHTPKAHTHENIIRNNNDLAERVTINKLYSSSASYCANELINTMIDNGDLKNNKFTASAIDNGYYYLLDNYANDEMKAESTIRDDMAKISQLAFFSDKLTREFPISSFQINAKSDAFTFVTTINWETVYGNRLPYVTQKVVTMKYDYKTCKITNVFPSSFEECFNGKCYEKEELESVTFEFLKELVVEKGSEIEAKKTN